MNRTAFDHMIHQCMLETSRTGSGQLPFYRMMELIKSRQPRVLLYPYEHAELDHVPDLKWLPMNTVFTGLTHKLLRPGDGTMDPGLNVAAVYVNEMSELGLEVITMVRRECHDPVIPHLHFWLQNDEHFGHVITLPEKPITPMRGIQDRDHDAFNQATSDILGLLALISDWYEKPAKLIEVAGKPLKSKKRGDKHVKIHKIASVGYTRRILL